MSKYITDDIEISSDFDEDNLMKKILVKKILMKEILMKKIKKKKKIQDYFGYILKAHETVTDNDFEHFEYSRLF